MVDSTACIVGPQYAAKFNTSRQFSIEILFASSSEGIGGSLLKFPVREIGASQKVAFYRGCGISVVHTIDLLFLYRNDNDGRIMFLTSVSKHLFIFYCKFVKIFTRFYSLI